MISSSASASSSIIYCPLRCRTQSSSPKLCHFPNQFHLERHIKHTKIHSSRTVQIDEMKREGKSQQLKEEGVDEEELKRVLHRMDTANEVGHPKEEKNQNGHKKGNIDNILMAVIIYLESLFNSFHLIYLFSVL